MFSLPAALLFVRVSRPAKYEVSLHGIQGRRWYNSTRGTRFQASVAGFVPGQKGSWLLFYRSQTASRPRNASHSASFLLLEPERWSALGEEGGYPGCT